MPDVLIYCIMFPSNINFNQHTPHILVVDNFYKNPDQIRQEALAQKFEEDERFYKGKRSPYKHLLPYIKEEFERLLNAKITDWLNQPMNGIFQITNSNDPLVWHSDTQDYAGAVYLTPNVDDADSYRQGTSFWRDKKYGCRRPPQGDITISVGAIGSEEKGTINTYENKKAKEEMCNE